MILDTKTGLPADELDDLSFDDFDEAINPKPENSEFDAIVEEALSRRGFMGGVLAFGRRRHDRCCDNCVDPRGGSGRVEPVRL